MIHEIFNLTIKQNSMAPSSWEKVMITLIHKKGDPTNPENYRPICSVPATLQGCLPQCTHNRHYAELDRYQCPDQAGFRKTFQTTDHLVTFRPIYLPEKQRVGDGHVGGSDRLQEGNRFYTTCSNLEISQRNHSVSEQCTFAPENLCTDRRATVLTDLESDEFGNLLVEQNGDPLSRLVVNSVSNNGERH